MNSLHLTLSVSTTLQILAAIVQATNLVLPTVSANTKIVLSGIIGIVQIGINTISHLSNPDGTSVKVAYVEPQEPKKVA